MVYPTVFYLYYLLICSLFFVLNGIVLGITLLARISIITTFIPTTQVHDIDSGLGSFNPKALSGVDPSLTTLIFLSYTLGFLADRAGVISTPPSTACQINGKCSSYLLTGGLYRTIPDPSNITMEEANGGTVYVVQNAPGYNLEFNLCEKEMFLWSDCHIYPAQSTALAFCLKSSDSGLLAGE